MRTVITLILMVLFFGSCKQQNTTTKKNSEPTTTLSDSLTTILDSLYTRDSAIVGFSVALLNKDTIFYHKGFGYADVSLNKAYTTKTVQNIGSISKTFIGMALLKAQELGHLQLDDPIDAYIPFKVKNPKHANSITIRQLATHTSSISDTDWYGKSYVMLNDQHSENDKVLDYFNKPSEDMPMNTYLEKVLHTKGTWYEPEIFGDEAPGTAYNYSNIGATLAALVIEGATKKSFADFTKEHILQPLRMQSSGWFHEDIDASIRSKAFASRDTTIAAYKLITYPDGGMITSIVDLSAYLTELIKGYNGEGTLLTKESYQELFKKQLADGAINKDRPTHNTGIFIDYSNYGIGHNGGDPGVLTFMYFDKENNIGKIVFVNTDYDENLAVISTFRDIWKTLISYEEKFME